MSRVRIILGDPVTGLDLADPTGPFEVYASSAQGTTDLGNPVSITETVESGLQDGTIVRWLRDDNRTVQIEFGVKGTDLDSLARAIEYQVVPLTKIQTLLTIYPPDEAAEPAVFEVWTSKLEIAPLGSNDLDEVRSKKRRLHSLTLTSQPYVRSLNPVVSPALSNGGGSTVVLDNGNGANGAWTSALGGSVGTGGSLGFPLVSIGSGVKSAQVSKAIPARDFSTTPYVYIDLLLPVTTSGSVNYPSNWSASCGAYGLDDVATTTGVAAGVPVGYVRFWFKFNGPAPLSATPVRFRFDFTSLPNSTTVLIADNLTTQGSPPTAASSAPVRYVAAQGSQRTPGSLRVNNCTLVYTAPGLGAGTYDPATVIDAVGSATTSLATLPVGGYIFVASGVLTSTAGTAGTKAIVTVTTTITQGSVTRTAKRVFVMDRTLTSGTIGQAVGTFAIGSLPLPLMEVPGTSTETMTGQVTVSGGAFTGTPKTWALWMGKPGNGDQCALTIPQWPTSGTSILAKAWTWIDAPTIERPYPGVWAGTAADKSDAVNMVGSMERWGDHQFSPGQSTIYVVGGQADLTYYPRWHSWPPNIT